MTIDIGKLATDQVYQFLMSAIVPRPIALVMTIDDEGIVNAAPFSSFVALTPAPPTVGIVVGSWEGRVKDTLRNIRSNGEFSISIVTSEDAELVQSCSAPFPRGVSEIADKSIDQAPCVDVRPPRLSNAPVAMECRVAAMVPFGDAPDHLIAGRIVRTHVRSDCWGEGRLRPQAWSPLSRIGGGMFCHLGEPFRATGE